MTFYVVFLGLSQFITSAVLLQLVQCWITESDITTNN
jgi:hypothetical protein